MLRKWALYQVIKLYQVKIQMQGLPIFKFGFKNIETVLFISSIHLELRCFIFSYYVSINGFTFACHALMVPSLLRRPRKGLQVPEYHLDAVELAVI